MVVPSLPILVKAMFRCPAVKTSLKSLMSKCCVQGCCAEKHLLLGASKLTMPRTRCWSGGGQRCPVIASNLCARSPKFCVAMRMRKFLGAMYAVAASRHYVRCAESCERTQQIGGGG